MELVDKWTTERKINDGKQGSNKIHIGHIFEEYIHPQTNQLLAVVET